jgi:hypothetical protein
VNGFWYLASPFSHPDATVREYRRQEACRAAGRLMHDGHNVFSPIAHSCSIEATFAAGEMQSHDFWLKQDFAILRHAGKLVVLMLDGWEKSYGVGAEIDLAKRLNIPVEFVEPMP